MATGQVAMTIHRRDFLRTASLAAGVAAVPSMLRAGPGRQRAAAAIGAGYTFDKNRDYPIQPIRGADVTLTDGFWRPKVALNATVTIPFEVRKFVDDGRAIGGNVLEAALLSLQRHPDPALQSLVDAQIRTLASTPVRGNSSFEVAATYYFTTGRRDLIDRSIAAADALYEDFRKNDPPFSGGERDAVNCLQLYRVTRDRTHLDLAKHYLDIRGRADSVNRSRHNQSYRPVLEQREAVGHAVNGATLMVSLADVGVLTGRTEYLLAAQRLWADAVDKKMYVTGGIGASGNEGFGEPYALPNISAYAETCAMLMFITLSHRLFMATGDSKYIDVMERGMCNNALSGVAATSAGSGRRWNAVRPTSCGSWRRCPASSTRRDRPVRST